MPDQPSSEPPFAGLIAILSRPAHQFQAGDVRTNLEDLARALNVFAFGDAAIPTGPAERTRYWVETTQEKEAQQQHIVLFKAGTFLYVREAEVEGCIRCWIRRDDPDKEVPLYTRENLEKAIVERLIRPGTVRSLLAHRGEAQFELGVPVADGPAAYWEATPEEFESREYETREPTPTTVADLQKRFVADLADVMAGGSSIDCRSTAIRRDGVPIEAVFIRSSK